MFFWKNNLELDLLLFLLHTKMYSNFLWLKTHNVYAYGFPFGFWSHQLYTPSVPLYPNLSVETVDPSTNLQQCEPVLIRPSFPLRKRNFKTSAEANLFKLLFGDHGLRKNVIKTSKIFRNLKIKNEFKSHFFQIIPEMLFVRTLLKAHNGCPHRKKDSLTTIKRFLHQQRGGYNIEVKEVALK